MKSSCTLEGDETRFNTTSQQNKMRKFVVFMAFISSSLTTVCAENVAVDDTTPFDPACVDNIMSKMDVGCTCGIFLTGQFTRQTNEQPTGNAVIQYEYPEKLPCTSVGNKICMNKCVDMIVKKLSNSATLICGNIDRNCYKEKAYLFFKNCKNEWINTNLSTGREFCCKDGVPYKCPTSG